MALTRPKHPRNREIVLPHLHRFLLEKLLLLIVSSRAHCLVFRFLRRKEPQRNVLLRDNCLDHTPKHLCLGRSKVLLNHFIRLSETPGPLSHCSIPFLTVWNLPPNPIHRELLLQKLLCISCRPLCVPRNHRWLINPKPSLFCTMHAQSTSSVEMSKLANSR